MKIALDYDNTFTADKALWTNFINDAKSRGHEVTIVSFRMGGSGIGNEDAENDAELLGINIVFTNWAQKASVYQADIWIDDSPVNIPAIESIQYLCKGFK